MDVLAGGVDPDDPVWPQNAAAIPPGLIDEAQRRFGYRVLPAP
jgi:hypothetical protein